MITSPARGADRVVGVSGPPPRALAASTTLVVLLLGALALRLTIAYILFPASGFESDITTYVSWAMTMAREGPGGFYVNAGFIDYPPGYLLVLWPIGLVSQALGAGDPSAFATPLIKLPAMLADIGVGWLLYRLVLGWAWPSRRAEGLALGAAALYVFNPVTWYDSALWGQTDSVGALVLLLGVAALVRGNSEGAAFLGVLAALVKPQFGVVLIPLVAVVLLRRHLLRPGSGPRHDPWGPAWLRGWLAREQGWPRLVTSGVVALIAFHVLALPFGMGIPDYLDLMGRTAAGYEYLTVNAYNPWALVGLDGNTALAWAMPFWQSDVVPVVAGVSAFAIGALLLVGGFLYGLANVLARDERRTIIVATIFLALAFFVLPTRVHERYLMPVFALLPLLAVTSRSWLLVLVGLSASVLINLHAVLTYTSGDCATNPECFHWGTRNVQDLPLGDATRTPTFVIVAVLLVTGSFLFVAWRLWRGAAREQDDLARLSTTVEGTLVTGSHPMPGTARPLGTGASHAAPSTGPDGAGAWDEPVRGPSALDWIIDRITPRPLRADRSATLMGEPPGRLDRLDLLMVLMILVSAMTLRGFRIAEPYDMYFDEVYHARTAMEFLQDWRYDDPHDIYEWTHPHLAKYAMALGIELLGDHRVTGTSSLGVPVRSAVIERRWSDDERDPARLGDRLYVATGDDLRIYDLETRVPIATIPVTATAMTLDADDHLLYLAGRGSSLSSIDTTLLDEVRRTGPPATPGDELAPLALTPCCPVAPRRMVVAREAIVVLGDDGSLASFDPQTGARLGSASVPRAVGLEGIPGTPLVVAEPSAVTDPVALAEALAEDLAIDPGTLEERLRSDADQVVLAGWVDDGTLATIREDIDAGRLPGVSATDGSVPVVAVSDGEGISFRAATTLDEIDRMDVAGAAGMRWVQNGPDDPTLYVAAGSSVQRLEVADHGPDQVGDMTMPGTVNDVLFNDVADLLHVTGDREGAPTVYVVDLHGHSVFMDVPLPFEPSSVVMDTQPDRPSVDRTQILAFANDGRVASVDVGGNAFGYRLPGVLMGALTAIGIYLLARVLFRRRSVALFAAVLALAEGMLFANPRIAMNDAYVTGFLVLAAALFAPVWLGTWRRWWQVVLVLPLVGVLLGLALASKWVAAYAIGGFVLLMLLRSSLGRSIALLGMIAMTAILGALAIRPAEVPEPHRNWLFLLLMVALTLALAAAMVRRPLHLGRGEVLSAVAWLVVGGVLLVVGALVGGSSMPEGGLLGGSRLLAVGGVAILVGALLGLGASVAGRMGHGPMAAATTETARTDPSTPGWLSPGRLVAVPWLLGLGCLVVVPLVVYVISYVPWVALDNQLWKGFPSDHSGQTLWDLTLQMYGYHNNLRATHAASSPWWAWPLNLKPVWYYQDSFAGATTGEIYDSGNLVVFWMGLPALVFGALAAWKRRSLPLTLVVLLFLAMWLPWARIDRATFQYHYYTSVPFLVLALGYLLAELWHGPAKLAWLLARVGAALCILGPSIMWLSRSVLCVAANVAGTDAGGQVCGASVRDVTLSQRSIAILAILIVAGTALIWAFWRAYRAVPGGGSAGGLGRMMAPAVLVPLILGTALVALLAAVALTDDAGSITFELSADLLGVLSLLALLAPAWVVLRARDARRFALGVVSAAILFLLIWYPNLTGLPLPNGLATSFQGLLPTWTYDFQFAVNRDPPVRGGFVDGASLIVATVTGVGVGIVMIAARHWHRRQEPLFIDDATA